MKTTSCGVLVINERAELLLCHATASRYWDIPKGGADVLETPMEAARRELKEETGLEVESSELSELGVFAYNKVKDLHLFVANVSTATVRPEALRCSSMFASRFGGRLLPEVDAYRWVSTESIDQFAGKSLVKLLTYTLPLDRLIATMALRNRDKKADR